MPERIGQRYLELRNRLQCEGGQTLAEYAMLLAFIAIVVVVAVALFGQNLLVYWQNHIVAMFP
jgi:Flp pilus assembly pilin Flp